MNLNEQTEEEKVIRESGESRSSITSSESSESSENSQQKNREGFLTKNVGITDSKTYKPEIKLKESMMSPEESLLQSPIKKGEEAEEDEEGYDDLNMSPGKSPAHVKQQVDKMEVYLQQEEEIVQFCKEHDRLFSDEKFPSDNRILFRNPLKVPEWAKDVKTIKWMRPHEISKDAKFIIDKDGDVKQGAFGESSFIGGIVIIATRTDFIEKLFIAYEHFDLGFVTFQFFKNGEWKQVIVDTSLPYDPDSKQICFSQCANPSEFWVPLMEKAYAKVHGCYENIIDNFSMLEGLIDLTGGVAECYTLTDPECQKMIENNHLWQIMMNQFHQKFYLGCINVVEGKSTKNPDASSRGIFENYYYGILDIREFPKENLKLIRIRNPWGPDGCWNGPFSDDSDEWDKHRNLRDELNLVFKSKKSDGTWWMSFSDWQVHFNRLYVNKVFPETWQTYSIESRWQGKTAGGVCPKRMEFEGENMPEHLQMDTDDRWFNNPQFRIKVEKETRLYINLMQEDEKLCKSNYIKCNFMIVANHSRKNRIWERPNSEDIVAEAINKNNIDNPPAREITHQVVLKKFEGKPFGYYMIIPNTITDSRKEEQRPFWLRLFSSDPIEVSEMPTTIEQIIDDSWKEFNAGGKRKIENKDNPSWCRNPQYFLNLKYPTNLKIILKKTGNAKKFKGTKIGMTICRYFQNLNKIDVKNLNPKGEIIKKGNKNVAVRGITRLLAQTKSHLEPPVMDFIERKLQIHTGEKFKESTYFSDEVASLYFNWNPTEGPFIVIPSLDQEDKTHNYRLIIYSDNPVEIQKLEESKNSVLIGRWEHDISDGGCHLFEDPYEKDMSLRTWTNNPKYLLKFTNEEESSANLKITLAIAEKNWKSKTKNSVGGMIGIYLLEKRENKITVDNLVNGKEPSFMPLNEIMETFMLTNIKGKSFLIMPATFEAKISGAFILSVSSDKEFSLERFH